MYFTFFFFAKSYNQLLYLLYLGRIWRWPAALREGHGHFRSDNSRVVSTLNRHQERPAIAKRRGIIFRYRYLEILQIMVSSIFIDFPSMFPRHEIIRAGLSGTSQNFFRTRPACYVHMTCILYMYICVCVCVCVCACACMCNHNNQSYNVFLMYLTRVAIIVNPL